MAIRARSRAAALLGLGFLLAGAAEDEDAPNGFALSGLTVPRELLVAAARKADPVASVDEPRYAAPEQATWTAPHTPVIGVDWRGEARAYPVHLLEYHHLVNAVIGGEPLLVVLDPFTATPRAFQRKLGGRVLEFGLSGLAYNSGLVLYDRETRSLWSQFTGEALAGPLVGKRLTPLPVRQEHMGTWRTRHPGTRVLERPDPQRIDYRYSPFKAYWVDEKIPYPVAARDDRFHAKEGVLGVEVDGKARAYLASRIVEAGLHLEDEFEGKPIRMDYDPDEALFVWEVGEGVRVTDAYWFAWKTFHPDTEVWAPPSSDE